MADDIDQWIAALKGSAPTGPLVAPMIGNALTNIANIPQRAIENSQHSLDTGTYDPAPTMQAAGSLMGLGVPSAEAGAAGIFGGRLAKTADLDKMAYALMKEGVKSPEDIWKETGWFRSPTDNRMKFEIPDTKARMLGHGLDYADEGAAMTGPAKHMFQHPDLYKAYPQLGNLSLRNGVYQNPTNGVGRGLFDTEGPLKGEATIHTEAPDLFRATSVGIHEMQHGIQDIEHFAPGGNSSLMAYYQEKAPSKLPLGEEKTDPYNLYRRLAGEVESRNAQYRHMLGKINPDNANIPPWSGESMDIPYEHQLIYNPKHDIITALRGNKSQ